MNENLSTGVRILVATSCLVGLAASGAQVSVRARDVLVEELLEGPRHRVRDEAPINEYMAQVTIESDFGELSAESGEMARIRILELDAIADLQERTSTDAFAEALGDAAANKVRAVEQTVTDPVGTAKSIGRGVGRLFGKARRAVADRLDGEEEGETEQAEEESASEDRSTADRAGDTAGAVARWYFGYNSALRRIAAAVGADPYTTNPVLREELDRLARAAAAGRGVLGFFAPDIPVVNDAARIGSLSWSLSREDLEERNREVLLAMGMTEEAVRRLRTNDEAYSPTTQTALVLALESLDGLTDRAALLDTASNATSEAAARMYVGSLHLLVAARAAGRPLQRGRGYGLALAADLERGGVVVAAAVDYLPWDEDVAAAALAEETIPRELWMTGIASDEARARLRTAGWSVRERIVITIPWPGTELER